MVSVPRFDGERAFKARVEEATGKSIKLEPAQKSRPAKTLPSHVSTAPVTLPKLKFLENK